MIVLCSLYCVEFELKTIINNLVIKVNERNLLNFLHLVCVYVGLTENRSCHLQMFYKWLHRYIFCLFCVVYILPLLLSKFKVNCCFRSVFGHGGTMCPLGLGSKKKPGWNRVKQEVLRWTTDLPSAVWFGATPSVSLS